MKLTFGLLFLTLAVVAAKPSHHDNPEHKKFVEECAKENNIDMSVFDKKKGEKPDKSFWEKPEIKCFHKCVALKMGRITKSGDSIVDKMKKEMFKDDAAFEEAKKCTSDNKNVLEKFFEIGMCVFKHMKKPPMKEKA